MKIRHRREVKKRVIYTIRHMTPRDQIIGILRIPAITLGFLYYWGSGRHEKVDRQIMFGWDEWRITVMPIYFGGNMEQLEIHCYLGEYILLTSLQINLHLLNLTVWGPGEVRGREIHISQNQYEVLA